MTKIYNGEKLKDQNKSNFSYRTKPILIKQLKDQKNNLAFFLIALVEDWSATITHDREWSRKS